MYRKSGTIWPHTRPAGAGDRGRWFIPALILALALLAFGATTALAVNPPPQQLYYVSLPEDDLSLASALRSPLLELSEGDLFDLAEGRPKGLYLWQRLREAKDRFPDALTILDDLRDKAEYLRPFDLIARLLTRHDGRRRLVARLGAEAEDGIDQFLAFAC